MSKNKNDLDFMRIAVAAGLSGEDLPPLKLEKSATQKQLLNLLRNSGFSKSELLEIVNEI